MSIYLKPLITLSAVPALCLMVATSAAADYPEREIRLIIPFGAGGSTDIVGRTVGQPLSERLGQPFVYENRGGAGGTVGTRSASTADNNGYTLSVGSTSTHAVGYLVHDNVGYHPIDDFEAISLIAETPYVLVVHPDSDFHSVQDVIDHAHDNPGDLNFGSAGAGSTTHLSALMFNDMTDVDAVHIPYEGNAEATTALLGQEIDYLFGSFPAVYSAIQNEQLRALGVGTENRASQLPDVPTVEEAGVDGYLATLWLGIFAPADTDEDIVAKLHGEIADMIENDDAVREALRDNGAEPVFSDSPEEFVALIESEIERYREIVDNIDE
ncbi:Bug family tripartite tricarboxylate transporter substrate binding protein [Billgrantia desiderata]|uniref:Tripartite tricarboxylate transporter substrate binding protein n=1 Tax=Billgrantia desiderata TaxID=52021 RepID=A0ABS9B6E2_9GAMM|nr:tripartite tricarboxylate transporter substrate binding protein [Halomonas desiderata]MCE8013049.1 tripartite tricarboxylate transporter substrate binding protein [Halomonas desiderata]MCE8042646.1 tripartite tricarboxylate transporter substrate binding protein [Halomonas desiderata]MCE8047221.1 tripartite tricarboxylate transporter substrate binding protein [Halomonas desiderata]SEG35935.1 Tripartite-type tricarboxylate transporter, receptor component TctC [Halomonas desiderata]